MCYTNLELIYKIWEIKMQVKLDIIPVTSFIDAISKATSRLYDDNVGYKKKIEICKLYNGDVEVNYIDNKICIISKNDTISSQELKYLENRLTILEEVSKKLEVGKEEKIHKFNEEEEFDLYEILKYANSPIKREFLSDLIAKRLHSSDFKLSLKLLRICSELTDFEVEAINGLKRLICFAIIKSSKNTGLTSNEGFFLADFLTWEEWDEKIPMWITQLMSSGLLAPIAINKTFKNRLLYCNSALYKTSSVKINCIILTSEGSIIFKETGKGMYTKDVSFDKNISDFLIKSNSIIKQSGKVDFTSTRNNN